MVEFRGTDRFQIIRQLGEGGMGVVYEAFDQISDTPVALKTLKHVNARTIHRFKKEFRALADLDHPNLVHLHELYCENDVWFFTMDMVEGENILSYVRPRDAAYCARLTIDDEQDTLIDGVDHQYHPETIQNSPAGLFDERRLRDVLGQLAIGIAELHAVGKIHRDIKPSNILVRPDGQPVLLDFGLVTEVTADHQTTGAIPVGTAAYMAPEQAASAKVGPEADWYSLGCVLYEALTGNPPFKGPPLVVMMAKQEREPVPPRKLVPFVPTDLDALCMEMLRPDPDSRPSRQRIFESLGLSVSSSMVAADTLSDSGSMHSPPFIGRQQELSTLRKAFDQVCVGHTIAAVVAGESGIGKSALAQHFIEELSDYHPNTLVLSSRCYERESVPFKAFDGLVDELTQKLAHMDQTQAALLLPADATLLGRLFPVMQRIPAIAQARAPARMITDPQELRTRAFFAFRELLANLSRQQPLVLYMDDYQWADADSHLLLSQILLPPEAPKFLLLLTTRTRADRLDLTKNAGEEFALCEIELRGLCQEDAETLARSMASMLHDTITTTRLNEAAIATDVEGHPLFIQELVRYLATTTHEKQSSVGLHDVLRERIRNLDATTRILLELASLAGTPLFRVVAARAAGIPAAETARRLASLKTSHLLRSTSQHGSDGVEPYHDRVRQAVIEHLDAETRTQRYRSLFEAGAASDEPHLLVTYLEEAGEPEVAARHAEAAAHRARMALAFDRAAYFFRLALKLGQQDDESLKDLRLLLAEALVNGGRGAEAAEVLLSIAQATDDPLLRLECERRSAEQLLVSGHVPEGLETVRRILNHMGTRLPSTPRKALASLIWRRFLVRLRGLRYKVRNESQIAREQLLRADVYNAVASGLALVDTLPGMDFQSRWLLASLKAGETNRIVRALAQEATFLGAQGGRHQRRARRLLQHCQPIAERSQSPFLVAWTSAVDGCLHFFEGQFHTAADLLEQAEQAFLHDVAHGAARELSHVRLFRLWGLLYSGRFNELGQYFDTYMRDAERRGDRFAMTSIRCSCLLIWLVRDMPDEARREIERVDWMPPAGTMHLQHYWDLEARTRVALYEDRSNEAFEELSPVFKAIGRSHIPRIQNVRCLLATLQARLALASAVKAADPTSRLRLAARNASRILREGISFATIWGLMLSAGVAYQRHQMEQCTAILSRTIDYAGTHQMPWMAAAAQVRKGQLVGGEVGSKLEHQGTRWMRANGVKVPMRFIEVVAPGFAK